MSRAIAVRPATHDDVAAIAAVCERSARRAYAGLATDDYVDRVVAHFFQPERLSREILPAGDWFGFVVAVCDDTVVGVGGTGRSAERPDACELFALYVEPTAQRRGIGSALVARSVRQATDAGAAVLDVAVLPGNTAAVQFYEARGFVAAGEREIYAPHGRDGGPHRALMYRCKISEF